MHHPVSAAPTEPASCWPLKASRAGGGGGGRFIPAIEGASGKQGRADGAPARPPAHRPPPRPSHLALNWGGPCQVCRLLAQWGAPNIGPCRSSQAHMWVSAGPEGPHPGLRLPSVRSGPGTHALLWGAPTALGARLGQCREQEAAPQHQETLAPQPCGTRQQAMTSCWSGETRSLTLCGGSSRSARGGVFTGHLALGEDAPPGAGPRSWTSLQTCPACRLHPVPSSLGDVSVSEATE